MKSIDAFMSLAGGPIEVVRVPVSHNKEIIVRRLLVEDLPAIEEAMGEKKSTKEKMVGLLRLTLCDEEGGRLITTPEHEAALEKMPLGVMRALFDRAAKLNGLSEDDEGN